MDEDTSERVYELMLFASYCGAVALREILSHPPQLGWFVGLIAAAACMFTTGYVYRGGHDRRRRERSRRRIGGNR